jgi:hypothetical protein
MELHLVVVQAVEQPSSTSRFKKDRSGPGRHGVRHFLIGTGGATKWRRDEAGSTGAVWETTQMRVGD